MVNDMVAARLSASDVHSGYILDGIPRTLGKQHGSITSQVCFAIPLHCCGDSMSMKENCLRRITGRRICPVCKHIYNIYSKPPRKKGFATLHGNPLQHRSDDTEEAFTERMKNTTH